MKFWLFRKNIRLRENRAPALLLLLMCFVFLFYGFTTESELSEPKAKAAFLFNLAKFVTWSSPRFSTGDSPLRFSVIGNTEVKKELTSITKNKVIGTHPIAIMQENKPANAHILFISKNSNIKISKLMYALRNQGVLVVSDDPRSFRDGIHVHVFIQKHRLKFRVNQLASNNDGVRLHAKLLSLADFVVYKGD